MKLAFLAVVVVVPLTCLSQGFGNGVRGKVLNSDGHPVAGATIIVAGGFAGWAESDKNGRFETEAWGPWFSVRHTDYSPVLRQVSEEDGYVEVTMARRDDSIWDVPECSAMAGESHNYVGNVFNIPRPDGRVEGPWHGEHGISHVVVYASHLAPPSDDESLQLTSGFQWHSGLPPFSSMRDGIRNLKYRGWGDGLGLDVRWENRSGRRSRWVGDRLLYEMSYLDVSPAAARYFDSLMESACVGTLDGSQP